jgi:hypothetical protein
MALNSLSAEHQPQRSSRMHDEQLLCWLEQWVSVVLLEAIWIEIKMSVIENFNFEDLEINRRILYNLLYKNQYYRLYKGNTVKYTLKTLCQIHS